jgi:hypothetical protein
MEISILDDANSLKFLNDPRGFMEVVMNHDPEARLNSLKWFVDIAICEIIRYGIFNDERMIQPLAQVYREMIAKAPEETRLEIFNHVKGMVENTDFVSPNAFLPFIAEDSGRGIVSTAVIDYVSLAALTNGDPMSRVKDIVDMIESRRLQNEGGAFGALLHLGDDRVCKLLVPLRDALNENAVREATNCGTGLMYGSTVDFYLDWLEGMEGEGSLFALVASGLALVPKRATIKESVFTGRRPFPVNSVSQEEWAVLRKEVPLADYRKRIGMRLLDLERSEPPPRVMPHVVAEWGLKPVTDPSETADLGDVTKARGFADWRPGPVSAVSRLAVSGELSKASEQAPRHDDAIPKGDVVQFDEDWWDGGGLIHLLWAILNPNGPTLYAIGHKTTPSGSRVYLRWMHMLGGKTTFAAKTRQTISPDILREDMDEISAYLATAGEPGPFHVIPDMLVPSGGDRELADLALDMIRSGDAASADWGCFIAYQRQFGTDFFGLAGAQVREYFEGERAKLEYEGKSLDELKWINIRYGHIPEFREAIIPPYTSSPLTPALLDEWWKTVNTKEWRTASLATLKSMWEGASGMIAGRESRALGDSGEVHLRAIPTASGRVYLQGEWARKGQPQRTGPVSPHSFRKAGFYGSKR